jgi:glycerol-3-phosphate dehydrogenase
MSINSASFDLAIIGGGINGCGIARDAAGRGARVLLLEQGDLASGTSSASTKLIHGGLRYLEHFEFGLIRESLKERERLWRMAPHIISPLRFVLPHRSGRRPRWLLRAGLWLYDHLGARELLPLTASIDLREHPSGTPLKRGLVRGWEFSDCWVDDARLVVLNARDAANRGAMILTRHRLIGAERAADGWRLAVKRADGSRATFHARALVNAAGPAVLDVQSLIAVHSGHAVSRVRGSHIVVPRLFDHGFAYIFQHTDQRIFFAIPYERDFTLIGTTERNHQGPLDRVEPTTEEIDYLCAAANGYFRQPISVADVVWSYAGVRALIDQGDSRPEAASRGYRIDLDTSPGKAPLLSVFGGKITTYRRLSEEAVSQLAPYIAEFEKPHWTASEALPGGDFPVQGIDALIADLAARYPFLGAIDTRRIATAYGMLAPNWLRDACTRRDLGQDFGGGLSAAEVDYCMTREWACTVEDMLWRRTKLGLRISDAGRAELRNYMATRCAGVPAEDQT